MKKIPEVTIFAHAEKDSALFVANSVEGAQVCVAAIVIMKGFVPAEQPVAWVVLPNDFDKYSPVFEK